MSLDQPYTARDISINPIGRAELVDGSSQLDQAIYRLLLSYLRQGVGRKMPISQIDTYIRGLVVALSEDFVARQSASPNYNEYMGNELVDKIDLVSYDTTTPGVLEVTVKVYLKSGDTFDVATVSPGGLLQ